MSSLDSSNFLWFHDTEERENQPIKNFSTAEIVRRPWKAFWPPRSGDQFNIWLHSEFPEVLTWQFDPDKPFDQPWRHWLRSLLVKDELGSCRKKYSQKVGQQDELIIHELLPASNIDIEDQMMRLPMIRVNCITYLAPLQIYDIEKPYFSQLPCGTTLPRTNLVERDYPVEVRKVDGEESLFKLDETGFQFVHLPTGISEWTDETVQAKYLPDISAWLKKYFQCQRVMIYNYNLRTNDTQEAGKGAWRAPIFRAHCDNTPESCAKRLEFQFPNEAKAIAKGRYRYIDIWRCVTGEDVDSPLAVCDYRSIASTDLRRIDIVYPHFSEEGFELNYNPLHRWFYKKKMSKDDVVLFKLSDNLPNVAPFAPHTAFIDPSASGLKQRSSIEIRAVVIG